MKDSGEVLRDNLNNHIVQQGKLVKIFCIQLGYKKAKRGQYWSHGLERYSLKRPFCHVLWFVFATNKPLPQDSRYSSKRELGMRSEGTNW